MKYNDQNKPKICMQTQSTCYRGTNTMNICGILWNATGINNPKLKRFVQPSDNASDKEEWLKLLGTNTFNNDWNHIVRQAGVNAWIGSLEDKSITAVQTMPWNFRPWGCGSGVKGSCNNGWIQFIICEDSLTDKNYFNKIYKEACELTAYLCVLYKIDPKATVAVNSIEIPTILCDAEAHELQMGADHKDMFNWLNSFGKTMEDVRNDVFNLIEKATVKSEVKEIKKEVFKIRKNWEDAKSQIGAYEKLEDAKKACDVAGEGYEVYNEKGILVYPEVTIEESKCDFQIGDAIKILPNSVHTNGAPVPQWISRVKLYIIDIKNNKDIVFSTRKNGASFGTISCSYVMKYEEQVKEPTKPAFIPYIVRIDNDTLQVRQGAGNSYKIIGQVHRNELYTIVNEKNGWGQRKKGGWICLDYVKKV